MKLGGRLAVAVALVVVAAMTFHRHREAVKEAAFLAADEDADERLAEALRAGVEAVWASSGESAARALVRRAQRDAGGTAIRLLASRHPSRPAPEPVADGLTVTIVGRDEMGATRRLMYVPVKVAGAWTAALELSEPMAAEQTLRRTGVRNLVVTTLLIVALAGVTAVGLGFWGATRPLRLLLARVRSLEGDGWQGRLDLTRRDEIGELGRELEALHARLAEARLQTAREADARIATLKQLHHADRLATMEQLAAGVAHELGTSLSVVFGRARMIVTDEARPDEVVGHARVVTEQVARMATVIRQLLDFSRRREPTLAVANLHEVVSKTLDMVRPYADKHGVRIEFAADGRLLLGRVDRAQIQQMLMNVVMNGIQAMPGSGRLWVGLRHCRARRPQDARAEEGEYLCLSVEDGGPGIPREHLGRIFEPFFTTRGVGGGTGLGLAVAHGIVEQHGGWIHVHSEVGRGSRFSIFLAAAQDVQAERAS